MKTRNILALGPQQPWELMRADWPKKCMNKKRGDLVCRLEGPMDIARVFDGSRKRSMHAAEQAKRAEAARDTSQIGVAVGSRRATVPRESPAMQSTSASS